MNLKNNTIVVSKVLDNRFVLVVTCRGERDILESELLEAVVQHYSRIYNCTATAKIIDLGYCKEIEVYHKDINGKTDITQCLTWSFAPNYQS